MAQSTSEKDQFLFQKTSPMEVYLPCCVCQGSDQRIRLADLGGTQALLWTSTTFLAHNHMRKSRHINGDAKLYSQGVAHADVHGSFANACIWGPRDHLPTHMLTRGFGLLLPFGSPYLLINVLIMLPICKMICSIQSVSREAQKLPPACLAHLQTCGRMMSTLATISCFFLSPLHEVW